MDADAFVESAGGSTAVAGLSEKAALEWLFSLADLERGVGWNPAASPDEQWKLGRTRTLLDLAGAPDRALACVLVAGTKGKGSTAAFLSSILGAAGVRAGLYTQPHLQVYRERIRVDGEMIGAETFTAAVERARGWVAALRARHPAAGEPTTFEVTTALALAHFARERCQVAVLEVGLGGRLDATNAVEPALSVITPISYDHTAVLGRTLAAIAAEKAGILRPGRPALLAAAQRPSARRALRAACRHVGAACDIVSAQCSVLSAQWQGMFSPGPGGSEPESMDALVHALPLLGSHQRQNAALAAAAAQALGPALGVTVDEEVVARGLARLRWPGRFEVIERRGEPAMVLDGAHNGASAEALAATLRDWAGERPLHLVVGINRDKDARAVLRPLLGLAKVASVWATTTAGNRRALPADDLARACRRLAPDWSVAVAACAHVAAALRCAREAAGQDRGVVCVTGSLTLVGQARDALGLAPAERLWDAQAADTTSH